MIQGPIRSRALRLLAASAIGALLVHAGPVRAATDARAAVRSAVRRAGNAYAELERKEVERLTQELDKLLKDEKLVAAFAARDRPKVLSMARPTFEKLKERGVTHWYFIEPEPTRTCFLRVHSPQLAGDLIERTTLSEAIATHRVGSGKELGKTAFALRVVKPISSGGKVIGYMELGEEIDHFFGRMKSQTGDDFGLLVDKRYVDRKELARVLKEDRWDERPDLVLIQSTMWDEVNIEVGGALQLLTDEGAGFKEWKEGGQSFAGGSFPVRDAGKRVVGAVFVRHRI
jgi:hypothetical protein